VENHVSFSIIMPCYNSAAYVDTALDSIVRQTYPYWELIAINDGSTDETLSILNRYASHDNRIKVFSKENGGYVSAVNLALEHITGTYFLFLGSDDSLSTNLFESIVSHIDKNPSLCPDCIAFCTQKVFNNSICGKDSFTSFTTMRHEQNTSIFDFIDKHPIHAEIFSVKDTSKCFRRSLLSDLRYFGRYGIDADGIFSMLFVRRAHSFLCIPIDGYYWTIRNDSVSSIHNRSLEKNIDRINNWRLFYSEISKLGTLFTPPEQKYLEAPLRTLIEISCSFKNVILLSSTIRSNARFFIHLAQTHIPDLITIPMRLLTISPMVVYFSYKLLALKRKLLG